ncbi:AlbA family DNA-binding domain-containing protein [Polyangium jinanense]|uniref:AlbA family DNA-binding domain-containing protein n=1 Tax=Polyangium jinanense TaxID=2829994 RepID=UPI00355AAEBF
MAKDVAGFANASGGTILVGAVEDARVGKRVSYQPVSDTEARSVRRAYEEAVRDWCSPAPIVAVEELRLGNGGFMVAVNAWPAIATVIGVRVKGDGAADKNSGRRLESVGSKEGVDASGTLNKAFPRYSAESVPRRAGPRRWRTPPG